MSPFFLSRYRRARVPIAAVQHRWRLSPLMMLAILFAALCAAYVWQMTVLSMRGYVQNALQKERAALTENLERAKFAALEQQSLARVEERLHEIPLVRDAKVQYVTREDMKLSLSLSQ